MEIMPDFQLFSDLNKLMPTFLNLVQSWTTNNYNYTIFGIILESSSQIWCTRFVYVVHDTDCIIVI